MAWAIIGSRGPQLHPLILNIPLARDWIAILKIPFHYLMAFILAFMFLGTYSISGNVFDIFIMLGARVIGYIFNRLDVPLTPLVLALILGPMLEENFQRSLDLSRGDFSILVTGPITQTLSGATVLAILFGGAPAGALSCEPSPGRQECAADAAVSHQHHRLPRRR